MSSVLYAGNIFNLLQFLLKLIRRLYEVFTDCGSQAGIRFQRKIFSSTLLRDWYY